MVRKGMLYEAHFREKLLISNQALVSSFDLRLLQLFYQSLDNELR